MCSINKFSREPFGAKHFLAAMAAFSVGSLFAVIVQACSGIILAFLGFLPELSACANNAVGAVVVAQGMFLRMGAPDPRKTIEAAVTLAFGVGCTYVALGFVTTCLLAGVFMVMLIQAHATVFLSGILIACGCGYLLALVLAVVNMMSEIHLEECAYTLLLVGSSCALSLVGLQHHTGVGACRALSASACVFWCLLLRRLANGPKSWNPLGELFFVLQVVHCAQTCPQSWLLFPAKATKSMKKTAG